jgi:hypothetical protein
LASIMRNQKFLIVYDSWCTDHFGDFLPKENMNNFEFIKGKTNLEKTLRNMRRMEREYSGWYDIKRIVELK